ncbi:tetratricopeptide repeat protein [Leptospira wolffii]|uniref:tetratricopeptide repeat protein n=1 Tax=Leptospira wolffii TaxID=409998 RepID=UPI001083C566|nr:tetratricopeptide repeat protein [Leptospira wolffii]TGL49338.1 tetratricopeptide repeat protein [Leptospira wolffii]
MKFTNRTTFGFILYILLSFTFGLSSEEDTVQSQIRSLINSGKYQEAGEILKPLLENNPTDVTLGLFQTEIWIGIGENLYQKKQYKSAFPYFSKAFDAWPSHPLLRSRYEELKGKPLKDHMQTSVDVKINNRKSHESDKTVFIFDPSLQEASVRLKFEYDELTRSIEETKKQLHSINGISSSENTDVKYLWYSMIAIAVLTLLNTYLLILKK